VVIYNTGVTHIYILIIILLIMVKIKCHKCSYEWETKSKLMMVSCPSCGSKVKNSQILIESKRGVKQDEKS